MAWLYVWVLAVPGVLLAGAPAAAASGTQQITDCADEGSWSTSGTLAYAVAQGGTWAFACSGIIGIGSPLDVPSGVTLTLQGGGQRVALSGGKVSELFTIEGTLTLDALTLEDGSTAAGNGSGGATTNTGTLTVSDSTFSGNSTGNGGGGAIVSSGTLTVSDSTFSDNGTGGGAGGAIVNGGTLTVSDSTFSDNSAGKGGGGGAIMNSGTVTVSDSTFSDNGTGGGTGGGLGGAIANLGTVTVSDSTFSSNSATDGGAIFNAAFGSLAGTVTVSDSTFNGNSAPNANDGGAIYNYNGTVTVSDSTFSGNSAPSGGAGGAIANGGTLTVSDSTLSGNSASGGGAIFNSAFGGVADTMTVSNSTLSGNSAASAGGGNLYGDGTLYNTIVANATSGGNCAGGTYGGANDLEYGDTTNTCTGTVSGWVYRNPDLGSLADNGGLTQTMALGAGSAAMGTGDPAVCASAPVDGFDQRGVARGTTEATCDIGAYQATAPSSGDLAATYLVQPSPIASPGSLGAGQTVAMSVYTETYTGAKAPDVPVYVSLTGGTGVASVGSVALTATPRLFISDANGSVPVQYTAGTAPAGGDVDTLTVADSVYSPVTLQATTSYQYPQLVFTSSALSGLVTNPAVAGIGPITVAMEVGGAAVDATAPVTVNLKSSSPTGVFAQTSRGTPITSVSIPAGSTSASFYYGDSDTGTPTLTVATAVAASGTQRETVVAAVAGGGGGWVAPVLAVTGISPSSGPAGATVTVWGSAFADATAVHFGSAPAQSFTVDSPSQLTAVVPPGYGTVDVTVSNAVETSATSPADRFTYTHPTSTLQGTVTFSDVPPSFWAYADIEQLAGKGIVSGFPDGTFQPNGNVTRAQFVKMLALTLGLKPGGGASSFADVPASAWFAPYVAAAVQAGIVDGLTPTTFGPNDTLTREQMAVLLARTLKLTGTAALHFSDDAQIAPWATAGVEAAVAAGYLNGLPNGSFDPTGPATRAQAAKVLALVLQQIS